MTEHSIPVVFDVTADSYEKAATILADTIGKHGLLRQIQDYPVRDVQHEGGIESWWFPEARIKHIDRNDNAAMHLVRDDPGDMRARILAEVEAEMNRTDENLHEPPTFEDYAADIARRFAFIVDGEEGL